MGTSQDLRWRKSSYSGSDGGDCIECAPIGDASWNKSSYSGPTGGECIEVADLAAHIAVRDSKDPQGPAFLASPAAFTAFVSAASAGRIGH
ncbi:MULTISPECIES: DUF397 domain-containing protein [unclassified Streptomyces]|uniref:DUF397 domain-containing protein n=1 Tax=unclassified Streptomyces TaxID=2593676 RepID=UPI0016617230|nr:MULTISPECIES: DUF397 domain-containing protein [unclassified Streptomyces]MBD0708880.1 DUF397 domain-containing protein [Streptomyces sp. CBMA291]MBD0715979.1 DUF397 domain-containing protein [Streptomyces sp. CBMA370]